MDVCGVRAAMRMSRPPSFRTTTGIDIPCPGCGAAAGEPCRETLATGLDAARALADEEAIRATTDVCACGHPKREHTLGSYRCKATETCRCTGFEAAAPDNGPAVDVGLLRAQRDAALVQLDALRAELAAERERCTVACGGLVVAQAALVEGNLRFERRLDDLHVAIDQRDEARARAEAFERDFADAAGELLVDVRDCRPGTVAGKLLSANVLMRRDLAEMRERFISHRNDLHVALCDRDGWRARAEKAVTSPAVRFELLARFATGLPCRTIHGEEGPYLSRYTLTELAGGGFVYLHFFHRGDVDRELHSHPWSGRSVILAGGYVEERREGEEGAYRVVSRTYRPGETSGLAADTFHRVDLLEPARGCWTLFTTGPKAASWGFWDRDSGVFTPWREALARRGLL